MNFGINLKTLREINNISQIYIAKLLNIDNSLYAKYEKEIQIIPLKHLNTICNYYNVSIDYIFNFNSCIQYKNNIHDINNKEVGKRLKEFRKNNKITQNKLAIILNTTQSVIAGYESGRRLISTPFLYTICKKYNISADYLLGKIDTPKYLDKKN